MSDTLRADGIKLSLEMTLITIRASSSELDPNARFLKLMGENRINLPFLCDAARDDSKSGHLLHIIRRYTKSKTDHQLG